MSEAVQTALIVAVPLAATSVSERASGKAEGIAEERLNNK